MQTEWLQFRRRTSLTHKFKIRNNNQVILGWWGGSPWLAREPVKNYTQDDVTGQWSLRQKGVLWVAGETCVSTAFPGNRRCLGDERSTGREDSQHSQKEWKPWFLHTSPPSSSFSGCPALSLSFQSSSCTALSYCVIITRVLSVTFIFVSAESSKVSNTQWAATLSEWKHDPLHSDCNSKVQLGQQ